MYCTFLHTARIIEEAFSYVKAKDTEVAIHANDKYVPLC